MRAVYNSTCDFVSGPSTASPGVIRFSGLCRFVEERIQIPLTTPLDERLAYVTVDAGVPYGPNVLSIGEVYTVDYTYSDRVAIPSGMVPAYEVLFVELVTPVPGNAYYRAHVRLIPELSILLQEDMESILQEDGAVILLT